MAQLSESERAAGVVTCSAGNHGRGIAYVAWQLGVPARIYVPASIDESKHRAMVALGAEVVRSGFIGYDDTEAWAREVEAESGRPFISAFDEGPIMAGNGGSLAVEVLEDVPEASTYLLPVGGGGLAAGFSYYAKEMRPGSTIIGCQLEASPALQLSLLTGEAHTSLPPVETVAGGLEGGIGRNTFDILRDRVDAVALLSEEEIFDAVRWMLSEHQYLIEPSAAVTIAACLSGKAGRLDTPAVVVLSGRNVSAATIRRILG